MVATTFDAISRASTAPALDAGALQLVPFGEQHLTEAYVSWLNNPDVVRYSEQRHRYHTLESCKAYKATFENGPNLFWAIERQDGVHLGNITATIDVNNALADIAILLGHPEGRGRGYGETAWRTVLSYLIRRGDLEKVTGGCLSTNEAMLRIMAKCGMRPDGIRTAHYLWEGQRVDIVYRALSQR